MRATVVHGMPWQFVTSQARRVGEAWAVMPGREWADRSGSEISVRALLSARSPRRPAAVRWLAAASGP